MSRKTNAYAEMTRRHEKMFSELPLGFAFSNEQFEEMMEKWGLDPKKDCDKIVRIGAGGYVQKKDRDRVKQVTEAINAEEEAAIAADETGEGFICDMFEYELENHEYSYTGDLEDALDALGYTLEEVVNDKRLGHGLWLATQKIRGSVLDG